MSNAGEALIQLRSVRTLPGENEFGVEESVRNVRLQPGEGVNLEVIYQPRDTARRSVPLILEYETTGGESRSELANGTLTGRGVPLELRPLDFDIVLVGRSFLASAQVVNRSVHNLALDSLFVRGANAASEGVFTVDRAALVQSGRLFLGSGDTTSILIRCRAERVGRFAGSLRLASARVDTLEIPIVAVARERAASDIIAKVGIRAEPPSAQPGDTVRLRMFLAEENADSLFSRREARPNFLARFRFDKYVLALTNEQGGKTRTIVNTEPRNRIWRAELPERASPPARSEDFLAEHTIPCVVLNADVERTPLAMEYFSWSDKRTGSKYRFESDLPSEFILRAPRANGSPRLFAVDTLNKPLPALSLQAVSPNPATESVELSYALSAESPLSVAIYSSDGRKVAQVVELSRHPAGLFQLSHKISALPSGAYIIIAETPSERKTQRLEVVR